MLTHTKPLPGAKSRELEELQLCPCCSLLPHALRFTQNLLPNDNPELIREKSKRLTHVESRWTKGEATALQRELESVNRPHEIDPFQDLAPTTLSRTPPRSQVRRNHSGQRTPPCCPQLPLPRQKSGPEGSLRGASSVLSPVPRPQKSGLERPLRGASAVLSPVSPPPRSSPRIVLQSHSSEGAFAPTVTASPHPQRTL